ncbi:hypothetical protein NE237_007527 [Protea cynaroides]|uniref:Uncharacterized protein n=1 Tax=Protea cynaroides TaxID=273540 RepID=A0A9Q0QWA8_9MAGN|nr:hypothetical protein NE237_007527 [Protea cynaroides]
MEKREETVERSEGVTAKGATKRAAEVRDSHGKEKLADFSHILLFDWNSGAKSNVAFHARLKSLDRSWTPEDRWGFAVDGSDLIFELAFPVGANRDHEYCNPWGSSRNPLKLSKIRKVLVNGYGGDITIDCQRERVELLLMNGAEIVARFDDIDFHERMKLKVVEQNILCFPAPHEI